MQSKSGSFKGKKRSRKHKFNIYLLLGTSLKITLLFYAFMSGTSIKRLNSMAEFELFSKCLLWCAISLIKINFTSRGFQKIRYYIGNLVRKLMSRIFKFIYLFAIIISCRLIVFEKYLQQLNAKVLSCCNQLVSLNAFFIMKQKALYQTQNQSNEPKPAIIFIPRQVSGDC